MYTEWRDVYFNPEIALSPRASQMMVKDQFNHTDVHCTTADKTKCDDVRLIDLTYIKDLDKEWMKYSVDFLKKQKGSKQPFFLYHATRGCHFDNYPIGRLGRKVAARTVYGDCMVRDGLRPVAARQDTGGNRGNSTTR